jgi:hypothetical protein
MTRDVLIGGLRKSGRANILKDNLNATLSDTGLAFYALSAIVASVGTLRHVVSSHPSVLRLIEALYIRSSSGARPSANEH